MGNSRLALAAVLGYLAPPLCAQSQLEDKLDAKLAEEWLHNAEWITDFDRAKEIAAASGKLIFAYFTRSYAP